MSRSAVLVECVTDGERRSQVKADVSGGPLTSRVRDLALEAAKAVCGNARAAAIDVNVHEAHFSRLMKDGTLRLEQFEQLGPQVAAKFGQMLVEHFGTQLETPEARVRRLTRQVRLAMDEVDQAMDFTR